MLLSLRRDEIGLLQQLNTVRRDQTIEKFKNEKVFITVTLLGFSDADHQLVHPIVALHASYTYVVYVVPAFSFVLKQNSSLTINKSKQTSVTVERKNSL